jgi:hypothetical protein
LESWTDGEERLRLEPIEERRASDLFRAGGLSRARVDGRDVLEVGRARLGFSYTEDFRAEGAAFAGYALAVQGGWIASGAWLPLIAGTS